VWRDAMAVDSLDSCGVHLGTMSGQVSRAADARDNWAPIVRDLPAVFSVEVEKLPGSEPCFQDSRRRSRALTAR
jgi:hypothetical protein